MKKAQVFISSTYIDLKEEREAAVEAILDASHIPAGMELFKAGNESQINTIKRWIDESDIYMLILGGRYGTIEESSGKSYTHLEYEYALEKGLPIFAVILNESNVLKKASQIGVDRAMEQVNVDKYKNFKNIASSKIVKYVDDIKDIKLSVHTALNEILRLNDISGWIKGSEVEDNTKIIKENAKLLKENNKLQKEIDKLKNEIEKSNDDKIGKYNYRDLKQIFTKKEFTISARLVKREEDITLNYMKFTELYRNDLITGITNKFDISDLESYIYYSISPFLISFGILEKVKVAGVKYEKIQATKEGIVFFAKMETEKVLSKE